jgi:hypothetical protein
MPLRMFDAAIARVVEDRRRSGSLRQRREQ